MIIRIEVLKMGKLNEIFVAIKELALMAIVGFAFWRL